MRLVSKPFQVRYNCKYHRSYLISSPRRSRILYHLVSTDGVIIMRTPQRHSLTLYCDTSSMKSRDRGPSAGVKSHWVLILIITTSAPQVRYANKQLNQSTDTKGHKYSNSPDSTALNFTWVDSGCRQLIIARYIQENRGNNMHN